MIDKRNFSGGVRARRGDVERRLQSRRRQIAGRGISRASPDPGGQHCANILFHALRLRNIVADLVRLGALLYDSQRPEVCVSVKRASGVMKVWIWQCRSREVGV